uniref:Uncharacterized protein n=1 Tax=Alexandrium monilatum TaxID=311494 RepID=A0A7S4VM00_9DINO
MRRKPCWAVLAAGSGLWREHVREVLPAGSGRGPGACGARVSATCRWLREAITPCCSAATARPWLVAAYIKQPTGQVPLVILQAVLDGPTMRFATLGGRVLRVEAAATDRLAEVRSRLLLERASAGPALLDVALPHGGTLNELLSRQPLALVGELLA